MSSTKASTFEIATPAQQKAYLHPVRMKLLGFLVKESLTISQTAERLKVHPANITHHFKILLKNKLIQIVEERDTGRVIEKYYASVAQVYNIRPPEGDVKNVNAKVLRFLRDDLSANIPLLADDDSEFVFGLLQRARIDKSQFRAFAKKLATLVKEFENTTQTDGPTYGLNVSLYPHKTDYGPIGRIEYKKKKPVKAVR